MAVISSRDAMPLAEEDRQLLRNLSVRERGVRSGQDIVAEGDRPNEINLINSGFACRYKHLKDGARQILGFLIPGDICDLRPLLMGRMDHSVSALGACQLAVVPYWRMFDLIEKSPRIMTALWRETMIDSAICYEWLTGVGRRSAYARMSHLFLRDLVSHESCRAGARSFLRVSRDTD